MPNRRYETLILIHPDQGDAGAKELVHRIRTMAEQLGAVISQFQEWGVRDLAYPIDGERRAFHALLEYRATPQALVELERQLKLMEPVLRYLSVRQAENAPPAVARPMHGGDVPAPRGPGGDAVVADDVDTALGADGEGI